MDIASRPGYRDARAKGRVSAVRHVTGVGSLALLASVVLIALVLIVGIASLLAPASEPVLSAPFRWAV